MLIIKLGIRNLFRNTRRSILSAMAIGIGLAALMLSDGFIVGMHENIIESVTETFIGHGQIHHKDYLANPETKKTISNLEGLRDILTKNAKVSQYSERALVAGMAQSPSNNLNVQLVGVDPLREKSISSVLEKMVEGSLFSGSNEVVIGHALSEELDVRIGERLVVTAVRMDSGEVAQELVLVTGVFKSGVKAIDSNLVYLPYQDLEKMAGLNGQIHEIVVKVAGGSGVIKSLEASFLSGSKSIYDNEVSTWKDLVPGIMAAIKMADTSTAIVAGILFCLVFVGILNTLFMAIYERMFEFGVLKAIGTKSYQLFLMIISEAAWLGVLSSLIGVVLGLTVMWILNINGVDYSGIEMGEATLNDPIRAYFRWRQLTFFPLALVVFTVVASIYPAWYASKLTIGDAIKKSL